MMQGYFHHRRNPRVVFDMFFRRQPFNGGFAVFAGLEDLLDSLPSLRMEAEDIAYLRTLRLFSEDFLSYLKGFRFRGDVYAMREGELVFPNEPLVRIHGSLLEAQLIESFLLNTLNFQTLIATKAARLYLAADGGTLLEFGLRRAQGPDGALSAARAAYIGGAAATSNTLAGRLLGIPVRGTMAHSWIMAFDSEEEAFRKYAEVFPDSTLLLVDTYDSLGSGLEKAIRVGKRLEEQGHRFAGIRLDSGDLEILSKKARERLDEAGLAEAKIAVSNELDEESIQGLTGKGAPIDIWGVGTRLVTAQGDPSLTGVYKMAAREAGGEMRPTLKLSDDPEKITNPGVKQVLRCYDSRGRPQMDLLALENEPFERTGGLSYVDAGGGTLKKTDRKICARLSPLLSLHMEGGKRIGERDPLAALRKRTLKNLDLLDPGYRRLSGTSAYPVALSAELNTLKVSLSRGLIKGEMESDNRGE
jgi:nicotinate phosphoribosyltransferase